MISEYEWPNGAVTFLFSDIEDSTPLWDRHRSAMRPALAEHDALLKSAVESNGGVLVKSTGDGVMAAFASPTAALAAALDGQRVLHDAQWPAIAPDKIRVRMGLHTGEAELRAGDYYGTAVNRAARIMGIGHGGQVLLSGSTGSLVRGSLADEISLRDLGEQQLKGLSRPAHVFQVEADGLPRDFPPLRTGETTKGNLPQTLTSFIGRAQELANIKALLSETRLLTLTGPGGTGKTRLSLEAGRHLQGMYDHGVWLVELAPLADEDLVPATLASIFDLREQADTPILDTLNDYLRSKKLLLILDNCEHLVAACARLASSLLANAPQLTILASSREGLGVPGETSFNIPALAVPTGDPVDSEELFRYEAVRLFEARARAAKPSFALTTANAPAVSQIVRRLDGIPLAIELAAARVKLLSVERIAARLDDRFRLLTGGSRTALPRQQTLRALIDWSYDLLDEEESWFLRQMAVFTGGWTLEAAEYVVESAVGTGFLAEERAAEGLSPKTRFLDALDLTASLVNKSLVHSDDSGDDIRYFYLETIRQYAREKLFAAGEAPAARDNHFRYFLGPANGGHDSSRLSAGDAAQLDQMEQDLDNLRAALDWGASRDPVAAVNLLRHISTFLSMLGLGIEMMRRAETLLEAVAALPPAGGEEMIRRRRARAFALGVFAMGAAMTGGSEEGYAAAEEAVTLLRDDGTLPITLGDAFYWQGVNGLLIGRPEGYKAAQEAYKIGRQMNNHALRHIALVAMARWALVRGETDIAAEYVAEARQVQAVLNLPLAIAYRTYAEVLVFRASGDFDAAQQVLAEGVEALRRTRHRLFANILDSELGHTLRQSGDLDGALAIYRETILEWQDLGHRAAVANQLENFAYIAVAQKQWPRAAQLLGAAEALREQLSSSMTLEEKNAYDAGMANLRQALDPAALQAAWQDGRALDIDSAVTLALSDTDKHGV